MSSSKKAPSSAAVKTYAPIENKLDHPQLARMRIRSKAQTESKSSHIMHMIYNPESKKFLDRTCPEWVRVLVFYMVYYTVLISLTTGLLCLVLYVILDDKMPMYMGDNTLMGAHPGLAIVTPKPGSFLNLTSPIIRSDNSSEVTYRPYVDHISKTLCKYKKDGRKLIKADNDTLFDCKTKNLWDFPWKTETDRRRACLFNVENKDALDGFGEDCRCRGSTCGDSNYGYDKNEPCVAIGLNNMYGWVPVGNDSVKKCQDQRILFICNGTKPEYDNQNFKNIYVYPKNGFTACYFPFYNQPKYQKPLAMIQVKGLKPGVYVQIQCTVKGEPESPHIQSDRDKGIGIVNLEFYLNIAPSCYANYAPMFLVQLVSLAFFCSIRF